MLYHKIKMLCKILIYRALIIISADWTGLEPATSAVTGRHSNQLNYQSVSLFFQQNLFKILFCFSGGQRYVFQFPEPKFLLKFLKTYFCSCILFIFHRLHTKL